jgi:DNA helicase HerA-like ATPase
MREFNLSQRMRFIILGIEIFVLMVASHILFGSWAPPTGNKGFWFYAALLGLLLGVRLDVPFYVSPADVVLYAAPAAVTVLLQNDWAKWGDGEKILFVLTISYCVFVVALSSLAIFGKDSTIENWQRLANSARIFAEKLGTPSVIYFFVIVFALYSYHRDNVKEFGVIFLAYICISVMSPLESLVGITQRIRKIWKSDYFGRASGEVMAFQTPGLILIRERSNIEIEMGSVIAINDPQKRLSFALALDHVGRLDGVLLRSIEISDSTRGMAIPDGLFQLAPKSVGVLSVIAEDSWGSQLIIRRKSMVGLVAPETSLETLFFEIVQESDLEEGKLVEVEVAKQSVTYQIIQGVTKEEVVKEKNTYGFVRGQAKKVGVWNQEDKKFIPAKWLPQPNAPVFLKSAEIFDTTLEAVGHLPGTNYGVGFRSASGASVGLDSLVTHNTAILGILGVGKSSLALELVERLMAHGVKVVCLDLTSQYENELRDFFNSENERVALERLQAVGLAGRANVRQNVEEGGSRTTFTNEIRADLASFLNPQNPGRLKIFNPSRFEVWRQDSRPYNNTASMASLTPAEITHIISDAVLNIVSQMGMTDRARVCLVYEEAHTLVPEWNSAVAEGDRAASNGTARAILQGRKYGLGCLLITQRTANVTKTILNQCNSVFAMRTFDDTGKDFLANYLGKEYAQALPSLQERHAIFFGRASSCENPVLIRLNDREQFLGVFRARNPPPVETPTAQLQTEILAEPAQAAGGAEDDIPF